MLNKEIFDKTMYMLGEIYNREITENMLNGYYMVLKTMNDIDFKNAVTSIMSNRTYQSMPKPAEIIEFVRPDLESIATLAVIDIENAISRAGVYESVSFEDPVLNSIIDHLGGWISVCRMDLTDWKFAKKDIPKLYEIYARRDHHPAHLVGMHERSNGYAHQVKVLRAGYQLPKVRSVPALNPTDNRISPEVKALIDRPLKPSERLTTTRKG